MSDNPMHGDREWSTQEAILWIDNDEALYSHAMDIARRSTGVRANDRQRVAHLLDRVCELAGLRINDVDVEGVLEHVLTMWED